MCSIIGHLCCQKNNAFATDSIQINSFKKYRGGKKNKHFITWFLTLIHRVACYTFKNRKIGMVRSSSRQVICNLHKFSQVSPTLTNKTWLLTLVKDYLLAHFATNTDEEFLPLPHLPWTGNFFQWQQQIILKILIYFNQASFSTFWNLSELTIGLHTYEKGPMACIPWQQSVLLTS